MREYGWLCKDRGVVHLNEARYSLKEANELASKTEAEGLIQIQEIQSMLLSLPEEPRGQVRSDDGSAPAAHPALANATNSMPRALP